MAQTLMRTTGRHVLFALAAVTLASLPARAHEFWLEPDNFTPKVGESVPISIHVGQFFKGNSYPLIREEYKKFVLRDARGERPVKGVDGDDPALTMKFTEPGLVVFAAHSKVESTVFETWERFLLYLDFEGLQQIEPLHLQQGKPQSKITEAYYRCAKLLMEVGAVGGQDRLTGMPLELVAERNPYALKAGEPLPVRLYFEGKPIADVQISAVSKAEPDNRMKVRTDAEGRASIGLPKPGPWLINAVHIRPPAPEEKAEWTSLWASMTFARP